MNNLNQSKSTKTLHEIENEAKLSSIINFWRNFDPRKLKVISLKNSL
jgi:hypothetical protein